LLFHPQNASILYSDAFPMDKPQRKLGVKK
jgi:hypothetical protein